MIEYAALEAVPGGQVLAPGTIDSTVVAVLVENATAIVTKAPILQMTDAAIGYLSQAGSVGIQTLGDSSRKLLASGDVSGDLVAGSALRLGRVVDPDDGGKWCWILRCAKGDPDTSGSNAKRMEFRFPDGMGYGEFRTLGYKFRIGSYAGHTDRFLISQIHAGTTGSISNPWWSHEILENRTLMVCRFDDLDVVSVAVDHLLDLWNEVIVIVNNHATHGATQVWLNDNLIVDYSGPLGETTPRYDSYLKFGPYEWNALAQWDDSFAVREIYAKGPYLASGNDLSLMLALLAQRT